MDRNEHIGRAGTGKYLGYIWDGQRWVDPQGRPGQFDPWQRTSTPMKALLIGLAFVGIIALAVWMY